MLSAGIKIGLGLVVFGGAIWWVRMNDIDKLARTIWGEARGEPLEGQVAVAWVVLNRFNKGVQSGATIARTATRPFQFSAWNKNDPNRDQLLNANERTPGFLTAVKIAAQVLGGEITDPTHGATHYHANSIQPPFWATTGSVTRQIGNHIFYKDVA